MQNTERQDIYTHITGQIIASLEKGVRPWMKPWSGESAGRISRPLRHNGMPYAGINVLILWSASLEHGFNSPNWMTYNQATELNAHVRKGEKGSLVVYAKTFKKTEESADGQEIEREIPFLRSYTVFNVEQIDGLPERYSENREPKFTDLERIDRAEAFLAATNADIRYRGCSAYYAPDADYIQVPPMGSFRDAESLYSTILHELCHWVKHPSRLNRDFGRKTWGDEGYAREELVAELGSAFLCADLELTAEVREDHAAYLASWITILKNDTRAIFQAAAHAQRAADYLHHLQPERKEAAA